MELCNKVLEVKETLLSLDKHFDIPYSKQALTLITGTGYTESKYKYTKQQVSNFKLDTHAISYYQIEFNTFKDLFENYLNYRNMESIIHNYSKETDRTNNISNLLKMFTEMEYNHLLAIVVCRIIYYRVSEPLPNDILGMGQYWKKHYNTKYGKGTVKKFISDYKQFKKEINKELK